MEKKKLLFVIRSLQKAGAEKYLYELIKHLDKEQFEVEVLTTDDMDNQEFPHFYYYELIKLNIKIHTLCYTVQNITFSSLFCFSSSLVSKFNSLDQRIGAKFPLLKKGIDLPLRTLNYIRRRQLEYNKIKYLSKKFDGVILIDALFHDNIRRYIYPKVYFETHLMCHQAQFDESFKLYKTYCRDKSHNFVYIDDVQIQELEKQHVKIASKFKFPLSIDFNELNSISLTEDSLQNKEINIGVFTRINRIKPLDTVINAFSILKKLNSNVKLKLFGFIQDESYYEKLMELIQFLDLENEISFEGHSENMMKSIENRNIKLVWGLSIFNFVGYAGTELCLNGVPMILNNIDSTNLQLPLNDSNSMPPYFFNANKLAMYTNDVLNNNRLSDLLKKEITFYRENNNLLENVLKYQVYLNNQIDNHKRLFEK